MIGCLELAIQAAEYANQRGGEEREAARGSSAPLGEKAARGWISWWLTFDQTYSLRVIAWYSTIIKKQGLQRAEATALWDSVMEPIIKRTLELTLKSRVDEFASIPSDTIELETLDQSVRDELEQWAQNLRATFAKTGERYIGDCQRHVRTEIMNTIASMPDRS